MSSLSFLLLIQAVLSLSIHEKNFHQNSKDYEGLMDKKSETIDLHFSHQQDEDKGEEEKAPKTTEPETTDTRPFHHKTNGVKHSVLRGIEDFGDMKPEPRTLRHLQRGGFDVPTSDYQPMPRRQLPGVDLSAMNWKQDGDCKVLEMDDLDDNEEVDEVNSLPKSTLVKERTSEPGQIVQEERASGMPEADVFDEEPLDRFQNHEQCGISKVISDRIVGGEETKVNQYPWAVVLENSFGTPFCGGSIISERYILTAAHCLAWGRGALRLRVVIGDHNLETTKETTASYKERVQTLKLHAKYNNSTIPNDYDIGLIKLRNPIQFNDNVRPICLPKLNLATTYIHRKAKVMGWGHTSFRGEASPHLREVDVRMTSNALCQLAYNKASKEYDLGDVELSPRMVCASAKGKDSCQGDSGGPLVLKGSLTRRWTQVGIVSWGIGCAFDQFPGVYTRVARLANWIAAHAK